MMTSSCEPKQTEAILEVDNLTAREEDWADIQLDSEHPVARGVQNTKLFRNIEFCVFPRACCLDNGFIKPSACCSFLVGLIKVQSSEPPCH